MKNRVEEEEDETPIAMLISSFSFLLPCVGLEWFYLKCQLELLDWEIWISWGLLLQWKCAPTHTQRDLPSLSVTNELLDQRKVFILKVSVRDSHCGTLIRSIELLSIHLTEKNIIASFGILICIPCYTTLLFFSLSLSEYNCSLTLGERSEMRTYQSFTLLSDLTSNLH